jgi:hypothetical protein
MRILRGLSSRFLPCGCLAGVYETYDGEIVTIVDARGATCAESGHDNGNVVPAEQPLKNTSSSLQSARDRQD